MKNMIIQNWFVMRKKQSTYIIPMILFLFGVLSAYAQSTAESSAASLGECWFPLIFGYSADVAMLMCGISSVLFLRADLNDGFIKNIAGNVKSDFQYFVPKIIILAVNNILLLLSLAAGALLGCCLFLNGLEQFEALAFFKYSGTLALMVTGISVLLTFVVFTLRNSSVPMAFAVVLCSGMFYNLFYGLLTVLLSKMDIEADFSTISITMKLAMLSPFAADQEMLSACILAVGYILVFGLLTKLVLAKKDTA